MEFTACACRTLLLPWTASCPSCADIPIICWRRFNRTLMQKWLKSWCSTNLLYGQNSKKMLRAGGGRIQILDSKKLLRAFLNAVGKRHHRLKQQGTCCAAQPQLYAWKDRHTIQLLQCLRCNHFRFRWSFCFLSCILGVILTRTLQDLAATKTFFHLAQYDHVAAEALQLSVKDFGTGSKLQLDSAKLLVEERALSPYFVMEQLMFWDHQPQRKSDVLCFQGAVELPCPTNIMRYCCSRDGVPSDEIQCIQDALTGRPIPKKQFRSLQFAANVGDAVFGSTALDSRIQQPHESHVFKTQLCHPVLTDSAVDQPAKQRNQWSQAERILAQRHVAGSSSIEYLVRWCATQPDSWEPRKNINDAMFHQWRHERR